AWATTQAAPGPYPVASNSLPDRRRHRVAGPSGVRVAHQNPPLATRTHGSYRLMPSEPTVPAKSYGVGSASRRVSVGSVTLPRLRARSAPRAWPPCDAHSLSARSRRLASALAPRLGRDRPAMLTRCRLGHAASPPCSLRASGVTALRCSLAVGSG